MYSLNLSLSKSTRVSLATNLKKSRFTLPTIRHEIFHILVFSSLIESSSLTKDQMEELGAEITAEHSPEIVLWAEQVMNFYTQKGVV